MKTETEVFDNKSGPVSFTSFMLIQIEAGSLFLECKTPVMPQKGSLDTYSSCYEANWHCQLQVGGGQWQHIFHGPPSMCPKMMTFYHPYFGRLEIRLPFANGGKRKRWNCVVMTHFLGKRGIYFYSQHGMSLKVIKQCSWLWKLLPKAATLCTDIWEKVPVGCISEDKTSSPPQKKM